MVEYDYSNIIIDPTSDRAKEAVGKECYFGDSIKQLLINIKENSACESILKFTKNILGETDDGPFVDDDGCTWECIILKKEEPKPELKPFDNEKDFMFYHNCSDNKLSNSCCDDSLLYLNRHGIWLHDKLDDRFVMVTEFWDDGVVISSDTCTTPWCEIAERYEFLDGSPCCMEVAV